MTHRITFALDRTTADRIRSLAQRWILKCSYQADCGCSGNHACMTKTMTSPTHTWGMLMAVGTDT